jgi:hypothetical protein
MAISKDIKFGDYVKLNEMKNYLLMHLDNMGLREQVRTMNDEDLEKLIYMMSLIGDQLKKKDNDHDKIEMLISYVICLWAKLIVDYGATLEEL